MPKVQFSRLQEVVPAMTEAYHNGASLKELASTYGGSPNTVRKALAQAGVKIRSRGRRSSDFHTQPRTEVTDATE